MRRESTDLNSTFSVRGIILRRSLVLSGSRLRKITAHSVISRLVAPTNIWRDIYMQIYTKLNQAHVRRATRFAHGGKKNLGASLSRG